MAAVAAAGVQAKAAAVVMQHLDPLQQQLFDLQAGTLAGDWEGALELVGRVIDALRQVSTAVADARATVRAAVLRYPFWVVAGHHALGKLTMFAARSSKQQQKANSGMWLLPQHQAESCRILLPGGAVSAACRSGPSSCRQLAGPTLRPACSISCTWSAAAPSALCK